MRKVASSTAISKRWRAAVPQTMETVVESVKSSHRWTIQTIGSNPPLDDSLFAKPQLPRPRGRPHSAMSMRRFANLALVASAAAARSPLSSQGADPHGRTRSWRGMPPRAAAWRPGARSRHGHGRAASMARTGAARCPFVLRAEAPRPHAIEITVDGQKAVRVSTDDGWKMRASSTGRPRCSRTRRRAEVRTRRPDHRRAADGPLPQGARRSRWPDFKNSRAARPMCSACGSLRVARPVWIDVETFLELALRPRVVNAQVGPA